MNKIAIVGLAARYPNAKDANEFWQNLLDKHDSRSELTAKKLGANPSDYRGQQGESDRFYCTKGGYIDGFEFEASNYQLSTEQLNQLDDSFLWGLDCSKKALIDANINLNDQTLLSRCGVVMGNLSFPTAKSNEQILPIYHKAVEKGLQQKLQKSDFRIADFQTGKHGEQQATFSRTTNSNSNLFASHSASKVVQQALGLGGCQLSIDAACASSVYAVKLACDYLNTGKADIMLAGAISGADPFFINMGFSIFHAYPENNQSAPFDSKTQGLFAGEGAGVLALKRLADAERDGDNIYAVISGTGLSNDGKGQFVLSPNSKGQVQAFERAYESAQISPNDIEVIECHATGTPLGDKVELTSMEQFFTDKLRDSQAPLIGSAKSNLGHLLTAAGMPGIMKMIFAMQSGKLPASINLSEPINSPNGLFNGENIPTETKQWPDKKQNDRRQAGVSVFGFGGCNAHLLLESYLPTNTIQSEFSQTQPETLSIAGIAAHFGPLSSINALHNAVKLKQPAFVSVPPNRWKGLQHHHELLNEFGLSQAPQGAYIENFDFDFLRFKVPPNEDDRLIAQQLLLIKVADEAIRDAKLTSGSKVAVLVAMETEPELHLFRGRVNLHTQLSESFKQQGITLSDEEYQQLEAITMDSVLDAAKLNQYTSFIGNIMASRIASLWDFNGPAFTISAAEHSVARCIDVAENLMSQESLDAVVIAAVDLSGSAEQVLTHNQIRPVNISSTENCWNVGEGAGAFVLTKPNSNSTSYGDILAPRFSQGTQTDLLTVNHVDPENIAFTEVNNNISESENSPAAHISAQHLIGHCFSASGMASILNCLLNLPNWHKKLAKVSTYSEQVCSELLIRQSVSQQDHLLTRLSQELTWSDQKHLIKTVTLGGRDIVKHITDADISALDSIRTKVSTSNRTLKETSTQKAISSVDNKTNNMKTQPSTKPETSTANVDHSATSQTDWQALAANQQFARKAHSAYLKTRHQGLQIADALLQQTARLPQAVTHAPRPQQNVTAPNHAQVPAYTPPIPASKPCIWDYHDLVEYAEGDIANVFGQEYAVIDNYPRRVRLPTSDYLLVSRVTKLNAAVHQYKPSTMTTEYDIPVDAPYLVNGQIPWAVAVESGQCDLMLISYLGIDFENQGDRVYRLLDCTLTFLGDLPRGGNTLRYDISINHFARNGDTLLFFFSYECFVNDKMILKMDGGCAGFFTDQELADGKGVIRSEDEIKARQLAITSPNKAKFNPLLHCAQTQFNYQQIHHLLNGDIGACFGGQHQTETSQQKGLSFASEKFLMIEQINQLDTQGGAWGLGFVEGEKQIAPNHWYFPCHFKDDPVMAGSLMAEGCGQLLQLFMLHIGMHTNVKQGRFQPLKDASQKVRCRGQVLPQHGTLTYRMEVTEISMKPRPFAKANIDILLNGKVVVDFQNLGVMIKEEVECARYSAKMPAQNKQLSNIVYPFGYNPNAPLMAQKPDLNAPKNKGVIPLQHVEAPICVDYPNRQPDSLPFTPYHLFEFATGDIEKCFGSEFNIYRELTPPRTPCGDLQLTTRVIDIQGQRGDLKQASSCIAEYEVPTDAWYFAKNNHHSVMPYSVLMEISLQPNGFVSAYMGTTLKFPKDELFFRNLDGSGTLLREVDLRGKTIVNDSKLLSTVVAGSNIIQNFTFELSTDGEVFYRGTAVFGYFKEQALTHQLGLDNGQVKQAWHIENGIKADCQINLLDKTVRSFNPPANKPHYRLAGGQLNFIDKVDIVSNGGKAKLGYLYAERTVDPSDWFFQFHFHQDPVMPGSLGVEAIIELMQTFAIEKDLGAGYSNPRFGQILSNIKWKYRGQITPHNKQMSLDVHITEIRTEDKQVVVVGDASLSKDGLRIYELSDIAICITEAETKEI
ncbi:3-hydroxyacyl-[acyl-carrier-protein] dehydratase FabA [Parashewanella spongiae]|uniref:3-hydroxyacyl-[acyl-carrier-protein] dehydratase FabA n=1 Tax=Parashewanella spongiae TaxID=342950 RepID=A0A3A6UA23_9GAMM|nr:beta-ketoacyl synthase N-terminal-like domain-containing protein [Parashewanella spongiae]RJY18804.1 3-hydroxyacyl-[acyl-carrier-protein] dehydratase FabA [Parashewanella spongiae]